LSFLLNYVIFVIYTMNSKTTLSITEARKKIFDIAEDVQKPGKFYTFTENGVPKAILMSAEQFDSLMEDLELANDPGFAKRMAAVEKELERGEYVSWEEAKRQLGWDKFDSSFVMEKAKKQYQVKKNGKIKRKQK
jgi:antitoxin YefM